MCGPQAQKVFICYRISIFTVFQLVELDEEKNREEDSSHIEAWEQNRQNLDRVVHSSVWAAGD